MAPTEPIVASAVVVPEPAAPPTPEPALPIKRRLSSVSVDDNKRPRLSVDGNNGADAEAPPKSPSRHRTAERRKTAQAEERKRGQRLFGGLLGTLSQSSSDKAQKRRAEIERKQQEKLKIQQSELDENKKQKRDRVIETRRHEQKKFDEQSMRIRHSNTLAMAHFLQTKTQPTLYYKPWELRPEEAAQIDCQVKNAEEAIEAELKQFEESRVAQDQSSNAGHATKKADEDVQMDMATTKTEAERNVTEADEAQRNEAQTNPSNDDGEQSHDNHEDNSETVLEAEEDTVIY
ncbi:hypothetical protein K490DRAFT_75295 [Saccharata proteae CBS 121410]|uniref:Pinin/SDK/MemA protein domain-containing protein n=1 Tax=Saccharata proteae CBS 121410 TaxID=1314787 RepID=A0A9P4HSL3_9PEZI|nr:hypothetical protein K490DRAFT_75295 [Saccharata proteae CBS 121410]